MKILVSRNKGFGLIEIMVVISIISILSGVSFSTTSHMRGKAKTAKVRTEVRSVENALEVYASTVGGFPNPDLGTRQLYCVGSTECAFQGKAVTDKLLIGGMPIEGMPEFEDGLVAFQA